jgi:hypothetical protein
MPIASRAARNWRRAGAHPHCGHRRKCFVGDAERQAGMNSSRRVTIGVGDRKIDRHRGACRHTSHKTRVGSIV